MYAEAYETLNKIEFQRMRWISYLSPCFATVGLEHNYLAGAASFQKIQPAYENERNLRNSEHSLLKRIDYRCGVECKSWIISEPRESTTFWPPWWRISLSIKVRTTLNHFRLVFYHNIQRHRKCLFQSVTNIMTQERASVVYNFLAIWLVYFPKCALLIGYYIAWQIDASITRAGLSGLLSTAAN